jgi:hypothetical protein
MSSSKVLHRSDQDVAPNPVAPVSAVDMGWRADIPIHPAALLFPRMTADELFALSKDIAANGLRMPIALLCTGAQGEKCQLIDGVSRLDAMERAGIRFELRYHHRRRRGPWSWSFETGIDAPGAPVVLTDPDEVVPFIISTNAHRRHMTAADKRKAIAKLLKMVPGKSDREIGRIVKADGKTVAVVRAEEEARAEIPHVETRTDAKGRKQPAKKRTTPCEKKSSSAVKSVASDSASDEAINRCATEYPDLSTEESSKIIPAININPQRRLLRRMFDTVRRSETPGLPVKERRDLVQNAALDLVELVRSAVRDGHKPQGFDLIYRAEEMH